MYGYGTNVATHSAFRFLRRPVNAAGAETADTPGSMFIDIIGRLLTPLPMPVWPAARALLRSCVVPPASPAGDSG